MPVNDKKRAYGSKLVEYIETYKAIFIVGVDNVGSRQMQQIRFSLRGQDAAVLMGKNTTIRKVIKDFLKKNPGHPIESLLPLISLNVGLIFTNADLKKIRDLVLTNKVPAPARVGAIAPTSVDVPPGPTGCDPGQTSWFQALNIPTKINKGQIEIVSMVKLVKEGTKVTDSQAALLQKLNIKPFSYGLVVQSVYDAGAIYPPEVLDTGDSELLAKFSAGVATFAALSFGLALPNKATLVHSVNNAYKSLLAVAIAVPDAKFPRADAFIAFLANPGAFASAAPAAAAAGGGEAKKEAVEEKPKEEEKEADMGGAGGLFGDDEW